MPVIIEHESVRAKKRLKDLKMQLELFTQEAHSSIAEPCKVKMESIVKIKESTKKLLVLLEEIHSKVYSEPAVVAVNTGNTSETLDPLESATSIQIQEEYDDCSIYKRLTRKCNCLNQQEYNDFMIHFNDAPNNITSKIGEVIKNIKILKKFLYMGGGYTIRALIFLNEGLQKSTYQEKLDIIQGCTHSDICNVFEPRSIITIFIALPCESDPENTSIIQMYTAEFVYQLAHVEEGRKYLNYTSRVINDIKRVIKKKPETLDPDVLRSLNTTLNLLQTKTSANSTIAWSFVENRHQQFPTKNITCARYKSFGHHTMASLSRCRHYMTLDEIFAHLDILLNLSYDEKGRNDLNLGLPIMVPIFTAIVKKYNNSELNILITSILDNILTKGSNYCLFCAKKSKQNSQPIVECSNVDAASKVQAVQASEEVQMVQPIEMKDRCCQVSLIKARDETTTFLRFQDSTLKQSTNKESARSNVIIVPIEKEFYDPYKYNKSYKINYK